MKDMFARLFMITLFLVYAGTCFPVYAVIRPPVTPLVSNGMVITFYVPYHGEGCENSMEGCDLTSRRGLDNRAVPQSLDQVRFGQATYVTLASCPNNYGKYYAIGSITYKSALDDKMYTVKDVVGYVHDTGGAFRNGVMYHGTDGCNKIDVATTICTKCKTNAQASAYATGNNVRYKPFGLGVPPAETEEEASSDDETGRAEEKTADKNQLTTIVTTASRTQQSADPMNLSSLIQTLVSSGNQASRSASTINTPQARSPLDVFSNADQSLFMNTGTTNQNVRDGNATQALTELANKDSQATVDNQTSRDLMPTRTTSAQALHVTNQPTDTVSPQLSQSGAHASLSTIRDGAYFTDPQTAVSAQPPFTSSDAAGTHGIQTIRWGQLQVSPIPVTS